MIHTVKVAACQNQGTVQVSSVDSAEYLYAQEGGSPTLGTPHLKIIAIIK